MARRHRGPWRRGRSPGEVYSIGYFGRTLFRLRTRQDARIAVDISNDNSSSQPACRCSSRGWVSVPLATEGPLRTAAAPTANELCGPVAPSGACTVECAYLPASVPASVTVQERQPPADAEVTSAAALRSQHASVAVPGVVTCPNRLTGSCRKSDTETNSAALVI